MNPFISMALKKRHRRGLLILSLLFLSIVILSKVVNDKESNFLSYDIIQNSLDSFSSVPSTDWSRIEIPSPDTKPVSPLELLPKIDEKLRADPNTEFNFLNLRKGKQFRDSLIQERCNFYFRNLYTLNPRWKNPLSTIVNRGTYPDENKIKLDVERQRIYDTCFIKYANEVDVSKVFAEGIEDPFVTSVFNDEAPKDGKIFEVTDELNFDQFDFEKRMFPYINEFNQETFGKIIPKFIHSDGKVLDTGSIPRLNSPDFEDYEVTEYYYDPKSSFWSNWNKMSSIVSHRGIVLTFDEGSLDYILKLIATLRYQGNKLPIQVIFKNDELSEESFTKVHEVAQSRDFKLPETELDIYNEQLQNVWFVDVTNSLDKDVISLFSKFKNKWLANMFNLFEEFIFLDADTVAYIDLNEFFETKEYLNSGTIFFKDRLLRASIKENCLKIIDTLRPSISEAKYFDIIPYFDHDEIEFKSDNDIDATEKVYQNFFYLNKLHHMDSGLYAINKNEHIISITLGTTFHLLIDEGICGYGDKEFIWLGFVFSYHAFNFHSENAASVGRFEKLIETNIIMRGRVCSIQIAHISETGHLLWVNSGGSNCKFNDQAAKDFEEPNAKPLTSHFKNLEEFKKFYREEPMIFEDGIIPPMKYNVWSKPIMVCKGYNWCALYEKKKKYLSFEDYTEYGKLVKFSDEEKLKVNSINIVWTRQGLETSEKE